MISQNKLDLFINDMKNKYPWQTSEQIIKGVIAQWETFEWINDTEENKKKRMWVDNNDINYYDATNNDNILNNTQWNWNNFNTFIWDWSFFWWWIWSVFYSIIITIIYIYIMEKIYKYMFLYILYWKNIPNELENKIWHRFIKILFIITIPFFFVFILMITHVIL